MKFTNFRYICKIISFQDTIIDISHRYSHNNLFDFAYDILIYDSAWMFTILNHIDAHALRTGSPLNTTVLRNGYIQPGDAISKSFLMNPHADDK